MVEVVGAIASIAALVQITAQVSTYCFYYIGSVKNGPREMTQLFDELESLKGILENLGRAIKDKGSPAQAISLGADLITPLQKCSGTVATLQSILKPSTRTKFMRHLLHMTWPLKASETLQTISQLERYKSLFNLALTAEQFVLSRVIELFSRETNEAVGDLFDMVKNEFAAQSSQRLADAAFRAGKKRMEVLNWLYPGTINQKHIEISGRRQDHTGIWLLREPLFQDWVANSGCRLLWGFGIPGAGKTFLSSRVIDELEQRAVATTGCAVAHIYFNYKDQDQQTPSAVVSSLIKQLCTTPPAMALGLPQEIEALFATQHLTPRFKKLVDALLATLNLFSRTFFIFDALDECDERQQRRELLPLFHRLSENGASVFLTSRPYPCDIDVSLSLSRKMELSAKEEDITIYIEETIKAHSHASRLIHNKLRDEVIHMLVDCCKGMFLLVHFYIEHLCQQTTENQIRSELQRLNASLAIGTKNALDETYSRAIASIYGQHPAHTELATKILTWLVKARRTLTVEELRTAVSVDPDTSDLGEADMPDQAMLVEVCAGLVIIDSRSDTIKLAHYSVQEYLDRCPFIQEPANLELTIASSCLNFLAFDTFAYADVPWDPYIPHPIDYHYDHNFRGQIDRYPFLLYVLEHLDSHLQACSGGSLPDNLIRFLRDDKVLRYYVLGRYDFFNRRRGLRGLFLSSPLHEASRWGHTAAVYYLLGEGACISGLDSTRRTVLHTAAENGHVDVARILLGEGADLEARSSSGYTPLHEANDEHVARLLVENGANIEAQGNDGKTPLHTAVINSRVGVAKVLVRRGANVQAPISGEGRELFDRIPREPQTSLYIAASRGDLDMAQLLLENGSEIDARGPHSCTPLFAAVWSQSIGVSRLLLDNGADIDARSTFGWTPLVAAVCMEQMEIARLLLNRGADVLPGGGSTPLLVAKTIRHQGFIDLLKPLDAAAAARTIGSGDKTFCSPVHEFFDIMDIMLALAY